MPPAVCSCAEPPRDGGSRKQASAGRRAVDAAAEQRGALPARLPPPAPRSGSPAWPGAPCSERPWVPPLHAWGS